MYLIIIQDGFSQRYIGPYLTTKQASDDLQRILIDSSKKASWQIHCLEKPANNLQLERIDSVFRENILPKNNQF